MSFQLAKYIQPDFTEERFASAPNATLVKAPRAKAAPKGFLATSIFPEYFKIDGKWYLAEDSRMDAVPIWDGEKIRVVEFRNIKEGDSVVVGRTEDASEGIYVHDDCWLREGEEDSKNTFERLGIPQAERKSLAGVGAQYDSELVYHNVRQEVADLGVVYTDLESAMHGEYADMIRKHFMKLVPPRDHKFAALHGAVWSGGSFVYVPPGVSVTIPLQSYFRLNAPGAGQFEHTLIIVEEGAELHFIEGCSAPKYNVANLHAGCVELYVGKNAKLRYSTIENWSKNMYNLNTKRAKVEEGGTIEWVSGSFGSHVSYLYPMSILNGKGARAEFTGITFAGKGQNLDTGTKVVHNAPETTSFVNTKSISKDGGVSTFRSSVEVRPQAKGSKSSVSCQSLMLDDISRSDTIPALDIRTQDADVGHAAQLGRLMSEEDARAMIVSGFADNVSKELPLEYAVEMNNLIRLEMKGSIG